MEMATFCVYDYQLKDVLRKMGLFDIFQGRENYRGWDCCSWVHLHIGRVRDKIMLNVFGLFGNTDRSCKYMKNREKGQTSAEMIKMVRYETTAAALNFTTYLLACNPDVQVDLIWSLRRSDQRIIILPFVLFNWNGSDYHIQLSTFPFRLAFNKRLTTAW